MFTVKNDSDNAGLISAKTLILLIGAFGFLLPVILILLAVFLEDCEFVQNSISAYYYTFSRNVFVGTLCAISLCLFAYKGYSKVDNIVANIAGVLALGVAFFPTSTGEPFTKCVSELVENGMIGKIHFISATLLFLCLAFFSLVLFTKSKGVKTRQKVIRNRIYRVCGWLILIFILLIAVYFFLLSKSYPSLAKYSPVFWLETFALWAFSFSWLIKSNYLFLKEN